jgi:cobalt-zinc-cadmium efflux system outer membrane protein
LWLGRTNYKSKRILDGTAMKRFVWCLLVALTLPNILSRAAEAQSSADSEQQSIVTLNSLVDELRTNNPELQALRKRYEAALTRPSQDSTLPDPRITAGWISNGNPLPGAGLGTEPTSNIGLQVGQEFPYPGKRTLKGGIARKEADSEGQMFRARELGLVAQLKSAFHELRYLYVAIDILRGNQTVLQRLSKVAEVRYSVGKATQQDLIKSQVEISILENRLILLEQRKASVTAEIVALLNRPSGSKLGRPESVEKVPELAPLETLRVRAGKASPMLRSQQAVIDSKQLGVEMARKEYYPDFDVMAGYYNQGTLKDMWEVKFKINVPIYFWRKQRYGLEESTLRLVEAQRTYRSTKQMLDFRIQDRFQVADASRKLMELYAKRIVPQSQFALESSLTSYETGSVDFLTVLSNFNTILEYETSYYEQQAEYLKALSNLEELVAEPVDNPDTASGLNKEETQP